MTKAQNIYRFRQPAENLVVADDPHPYLALFLKLWVPIGPLVGIGVGHYLSQHSQSKQRSRKRADDEARELLTAFNALVPAFTVWERQRWVRTVRPSEELKELLAVYSEKSVTFFSMLRDRQVIGEDVESLGIRQRWEEAMKDFGSTQDESSLEERIKAINKSIVAIPTNKKFK
jgi:hypothetical protein